MGCGRDRRHGSERERQPIAVTGALPQYSRGLPRESPMPDTRVNYDLATALKDSERRYTAANAKSEQRFRKAAESMPGGNTRTVLHYSPFPVAFSKGEGPRLIDIDGHVYTDF